MTSLAPPQMTLNFEPALPDRFPTLRKFVAHRVGDSFLYPRSGWQGLNTAMWRVSSKCVAKKFAARAADFDSLRVWRLA